MNTNQEKDIDMMLDLLYTTIESLYQHKQFEIVDTWLQNISDFELSQVMTIGILVSTLPAKNKLLHRNKFYSIAEQRFGSELLKGLK